MSNTEIKKYWRHPIGVEIRESAIPIDRPDYKQWVRRMGIRPLARDSRPDYLERIREINARMGVELPRTWFEELFPKEIW